MVRTTTRQWPTVTLVAGDFHICLGAFELVLLTVLFLFNLFLAYSSGWQVRGFMERWKREGKP